MIKRIGTSGYLFFSYLKPRKEDKVPKGLVVTRSSKKSELYLLVRDSNGTTIPIKQTFFDITGGFVKVHTEAPQSVQIIRGELLEVQDVPDPQTKLFQP